jgi:hypothetical protein
LYQQTLQLMTLFTPQQQVEQPKNMTTVANDTSRTPLQAMMTLLSQPLAMLPMTATKWTSLLLLAVVAVQLVVVLVAVAVVQVGILPHLEHRVPNHLPNLKSQLLQLLME